MNDAQGFPMDFSRSSIVDIYALKISHTPEFDTATLTQKKLTNERFEPPIIIVGGA